jgi:hypothetical protein
MAVIWPFNAATQMQVYVMEASARHVDVIVGQDLSLVELMEKNTAPRLLGQLKGGAARNHTLGLGGQTQCEVQANFKYEARSSPPPLSTCLTFASPWTLPFHLFSDLLWPLKQPHSFLRLSPQIDVFQGRSPGGVRAD